MEDLGDKCINTEIAFFGGSFTAIEREYMISLLEATKPYIDLFYGIRISTRPDYIDDTILTILKEYKVTTIELGAQSMDDVVLLKNNRGHSSKDIINASKLIKKYNFNLGLQMMTGLYSATFESDINTASEFIKLKPSCVRIYPTIVINNTELENLYLCGQYKTYTLEESIELCSKLILMFYKENIDIIRLGLHYSESLVESSVSDNYHPAFKELCENKIFYNIVNEKLHSIKSKNILLSVNKKSLSKLVGQNKCNILKFKELGFNIKINCCDKLNKYDVIVEEQG